MSSASRPTWSAASGASKASTAQYSSKDVASHTKLKERKKVPMTINDEELSDDDSNNVYSVNDDKMDYDIIDEASSTTSSDEEEDDDEEQLLRELVKIKGRRKKEILEFSPALSSEESVLWHEESVFRVDLSNNTISEEHTNDATQTKYHKDFMSRIFI